MHPGARGILAGAALALIAVSLMAPSGGFPSRPAFQTVRTLAARSDAAAPITTQGTSAAVRWNETDQGADTKQWELAAIGSSFLGRTLDDTGAAVTNWLEVTRSGSTPIMATFRTFGMELESIGPGIIFDETDADPDERLWLINFGNGDFSLRSANDAGGNQTEIMSVTRTGDVVNSIVFDTGVGDPELQVTSGAVSSFGSFFIQNASPLLSWFENDGAADEKNWRCFAASAAFTCDVLTDSITDPVAWLEVARTGAVVTSLTMTGGADGAVLETAAGSGGSVDLIADGGLSLNAGAASNISLCKGASCLSIDADGTLNSTSAPAATNLPVGARVRISKGADTSRSSTVTSTADPDLQVTGLPAGHYRIEIYLDFTAGAGGSRVRGDISGAGTLDLIGTRSCAATNSVVKHSEASEDICAGAGDDFYWYSGSTNRAAATGTIAVFWSQNTSNAAATVLESESWLEVTRLN